MNRLSDRQISRAGAPLWAQRIAGLRGELRLKSANVREKIRCLSHDGIALRRRCYIELGRLAGDPNGSFFLQRAGLQV